MNNRRVILWFRNDLRLHDNEALRDAIMSADEIYPIYVFDPRVFSGKLSFGFRKTGVFRTQFILESVQNLRDQLNKMGTELIVRMGYPEDEIFKLAKNLKTSWIFCNRERTQEEVHVQDLLERNLWSIGQEVRYSRGKMLYYTADLPFPVTHTPDIFTHFRKEVEKIIPIRPPFDSPETIPGFNEAVTIGELPELQDFGYDENEIGLAKNVPFKGGEDEGLKRLNYYLFETDHVAHYKETRNELLGSDYSSKFSAYLAQGCLSPKKIYKELTKYEETRLKNDSTYHLYFELLWRDFFRLMAKKHGNAIFKKGGIKREVKKELKDDISIFRIWSEGRTGLPLVDAAILELNTTGYTSNRARQILASFLVNDLNVNWQMGAEYFESLLVDYDPCSNWGNWNYIAGVGSDPRDNRYFNIVTQAKRYDPKGEFVKTWLPQLVFIPSERVHQPYLLNEEEQNDFNCVLQKDYPAICVNSEVYQ